VLPAVLEALELSAAVEPPLVRPPPVVPELEAAAPVDPPLDLPAPVLLPPLVAVPDVEPAPVPELEIDDEPLAPPQLARTAPTASRELPATRAPKRVMKRPPARSKVVASFSDDDPA
jgi:hypothetical protein